MKTRLRLISSIVFFTALAAALASCAKETLTPLVRFLQTEIRYATVDAHFCTAPAVVVQQKMKYLFILDKSASNQAGFTSPGDVSSTDPQGNRRYGPLVQFVSNTIDPNGLSYFTLVDFNDKAYQPTGIKGFTNDTVSFLNAVQSDWIGQGSGNSPAPVDKGFTNYVSALQMALTLIQQDAMLESGNPIKPIIRSVYQVIFVSDGIPTVIAQAGSGTPTYTQTYNNDVLPQINAILSLKNDPAMGPFIGQISLNTAYYFQAQQMLDAEALLQQMANAGNGQYVQFGSGQNILYQTFAPPVRNVRYRFSDVFVENENVVWWDDGRLLLDSDGDGLPDEVELQLGSDPYKSDSDGNGVSDLVEYRTKGKPCADSRCNAGLRDIYSVCDGFSPTHQADGSLVFSDSDRDGFNDCEEFVLKSDRNNFDTNHDFVPDFLAMKSGIPFISGTDGSQASPMADSLTNYAKIKSGLPTSVAKTAVNNFLTRTTDLMREDGPDGQDCYHMTVDHVAVIGMNNSIKVYVVQNTAVVDDSPAMTLAQRKLDGLAVQIGFKTGDFK